MEHGEFAACGALLDLYPMGSEEPYRIDFFDDNINSLRIFDVDTQRTLQEIISINLLPAHEFPTDKAAIELFCSQWREQFDVRRDAEHVYQQISKGTLPAGTLVVNTGDLEAGAGRFWDDACARFDNRRVDPMRPLLPPDALWLQIEGLFAELKRWPRVQLSTQTLPEKAGEHNMDYWPLPDLAVEA